MRTRTRKPRPAPLPERLDAARLLDVLTAEVEAAERSPEWTAESDPADWPPSVDLFVWSIG